MRAPTPVPPPSPNSAPTRARFEPGAGADSEDTLDLRLPDELIALFAERSQGCDGDAERTSRDESTASRAGRLRRPVPA